MLNVLLESRAQRPRRLRTTVVSVLLHAALATAAVTLTIWSPERANATEPRDPPLVYVPIASDPPSPPVRHPDAALARPARQPEVLNPRIPDVVLPMHDFQIGTILPPIDAVLGDPRGLSRPTTGPGDALSLGTSGGAIDARDADRAPLVLGHPVVVRYPATLRSAGIEGRVVVQFVVDTLGRAELGDLRVIESPHTLFSDAVREALARFRFSPGEAGGRPVRTRVQIPFTFALAR